MFTTLSYYKEEVKFSKRLNLNWVFFYEKWDKRFLDLKKKHPEKIEMFLWGEQDSNLRRFPNGFTVRPRWPLEYLPPRNAVQI